MRDISRHLPNHIRFATAAIRHVLLQIEREIIYIRDTAHTNENLVTRMRDIRESSPCIRHPFEYTEKVVVLVLLFNGCNALPSYVPKVGATANK